MDVAWEMRPRNSCTWDSNAQLHTEFHQDLENRWTGEEKKNYGMCRVVCSHEWIIWSNFLLLFFYVPLTLIVHSHDYYKPILSHIFNYAYRHESSYLQQSKAKKIWQELSIYSKSDVEKINKNFFVEWSMKKKVKNFKLNWNLQNFFVCPLESIHIHLQFSFNTGTIWCLKTLFFIIYFTMFSYLLYFLT